MTRGSAEVATSVVVHLHSVILPESAVHLPVNFFVKLGSFLLGFFWGIVGCPAPSPPADPPPHPRASPNALGRGKADVTRLKASDLTMISKYNYAKSHESACLLRSELRRVSEGHLIRLLLSVLQLGRVPDEEELKLLPKLSHAWPKNRPFQERPKGLKPQSYKGTKKLILDKTHKKTCLHSFLSGSSGCFIQKAAEPSDLSRYVSMVYFFSRIIRLCTPNFSFKSLKVT